jgi:hypothetical protein
MTMITFDKLSYIDTLKAAGIDEKQARAQANALDVALKDTVATKADIEAMRIETKANIIAVKHDIELVHKDITIQGTRLEMLQWLVGSVGVGVLLLVIRTFWAG